jgi:hypothetical protein
MTYDTIKTCDSTEPTITITIGPYDRSDECWECGPLPGCIYIDWQHCCIVEPSPYLWPSYGAMGCIVPESVEQPSGYRPRQLASSYG